MAQRPASRTRVAPDAESMESALARQKIRLVTEERAVRQLWPAAPKKVEVVAPGLSGHWGFIYQVKEDLKSRGFRFNPDAKLWYRTPLEGSPTTGIEAFDLGGIVLKK
jgi:hypothetical protein